MILNESRTQSRFCLWQSELETSGEEEKSGGQKEVWLGVGQRPILCTCPQSCWSEILHTQWGCCSQQERAFKMLRGGIVGQWIFFKVFFPTPKTLPSLPYPHCPHPSPSNISPPSCTVFHFHWRKIQKNIDKRVNFFLNFKRLSPKENWIYNSV